MDQCKCSISGQVTLDATIWCFTQQGIPRQRLAYLVAKILRLRDKTRPPEYAGLSKITNPWWSSKRLSKSRYAHEPLRSSQSPAIPFKGLSLGSLAIPFRKALCVEYSGFGGDATQTVSLRILHRDSPQWDPPGILSRVWEDPHAQIH